MLHAFKWSHNAHITFFFGHFTGYAYQTSDIFLQKKPLNFYFKTRNHFRDEITRLVINTRLFTTLKNVDMFKIIEFYRSSPHQMHIQIIELSIILEYFWNIPELRSDVNLQFTQSVEIKQEMPFSLSVLHE